MQRKEPAPEMKQKIITFSSEILLYIVIKRLMVTILNKNIIYSLISIKISQEIYIDYVVFNKI